MTSSSARSSARRRLSAARDRALARAFGAVVARQAAAGRFSPEVLATMQQSSRQISRRKAARRKAIAQRTGRRQALTARDERRLRRDLRRLRMVEKGTRRKSPAVRGVTDAFHRLFYEDRHTWRRTRWRGVMTWKCPLDLWMYQELVHRLRPGLIIETGTAFGGSANYLACICDLVGAGQIVTVDLAPKTDDLPEHPRVTYLRGSSTDPDIVAQVRAMVTPGEPVLVILDSDHSEGHVTNELAAYADLVTPGSYVIVEDTNVNGHPAAPNWGPGPMEAVNRFLEERDDFRVDRSMERYHMTLNPRGFLKRRAVTATM